MEFSSKKLLARYANFRRYFPYFANLNFAADARGEAIVDAIGVLRRLESGELKSLPKNVDTSFVREAWRNGIRRDASEGIDRPTWEISLAFALREALHSARVPVDGRLATGATRETGGSRTRESTRDGGAVVRKVAVNEHITAFTGTHKAPSQNRLEEPEAASAAAVPYIRASDRIGTSQD